MPKNNVKAIFYCGTNGAGKSTLRQFNHDSVNVIIDSDHIAKEINPNNPRAADIQAGKKSLRLYQQAIKEPTSFSMESTLSGISVLQRIAKAKQAEFEVILNYVGLKDPDLNIERVTNRVAAGGHWIDGDLIRKRFIESRENLIHAIRLADTSYIYDNSGSYPIL
ncbi:zeta toxin family protein [Testudinibacter sp. TR-2022]|uniref:zeta toxin family protein n=1 Tax=Testudinibacter sp. TR-2022 TaxID=2585029 RepID=UPI002277D737|nr:zeta toxin family protein [Testudinibacter sp. TR-2022]